MDKRLIVAMAILMITFVGFGIIIPIMPEIVMDAAKSNYELHNGAILAIYSLVSLIVSPIWGGLSDKIGRKKIIVVGLLGFATSFLLFGLSIENLALMYVSRALGGLFSGAVTSVIVAYVADVTSAENRTKGMALVGISIGFGFMIGPSIGGMLSVISYETPFFVASVLAALTSIFAAFILKDSKTVEERQGYIKQSRWKAFTGPTKHLYVLAFFVTFTLAFIEATLQYFGIIKFNVTPFQVGILFLICGFAGALVQGGVVRRMVKPGSEPKFIITGLITSSVGFFLLLNTNSFAFACVSLTIFGIGNSLARPCITSLITLKTKVGQGLASGLSTSMDSLGRIAGPVIGSLLFTVSVGLPYLVAGLLCLIVIIFVQLFKVADFNEQVNEVNNTQS